jgi:hypothetical protein
LCSGKTSAKPSAASTSSPTLAWPPTSPPPDRACRQEQAQSPRTA